VRQKKGAPETVEISRPILGQLDTLGTRKVLRRRNVLREKRKEMRAWRASKDDDQELKACHHDDDDDDD
jgi:hypothetical protein